MNIETIVIAGCLITIIAVPLFDFLTWLFISIKFYKVNPLAKEAGRAGTYLNIKQYSPDGKMIGQLDVSFEEMFGITNNAILQAERDAAVRELKKKKEELENLKIKILNEKNK